MLIVSACGKPAPPPQAAPQPAPAAGAGPSAAIASLDDTKALAIMNKAGCAGCHAIDKKILGPSYTEVAKQRKGEQGAAAMLMKKIREGGAGAYGSIPMPPISASQISDDDLKAMVDWVLAK
ncbi:MAG: c-type cytochrome [Burkholderiales bacterium]|nr:c-type cytochrome [Burkholderiales bacterium]